MKNATTRTPAGGCSTNVDINADFPAHAGACHHTYGPRPGSVQYAASSRNSASRPTSSGGAIRSTCLRYADRTAARPGPTLTVTCSACTLMAYVAGRGDPADIPARGNRPVTSLGLWPVRRPPRPPSHFCWTLVVPSPVEAIPLMSPPAEIDRFPRLDDESDDESSDCPAHDAHPSAARAATATPSPAATTHRSAPDFSHNGRSNTPHTQRLTPNAATVTTTATNHLPAWLIVSTPRPSQLG